MSADEDAQLRALFSDAVADVDPADRLGEIRRRTSQRPRRSRRRPLLVVLGAGTATAAVVAITALATDFRDDRDAPVASGPAEYPGAVYFVSSTTLGPRLFREFQPLPASDDVAVRALDALQQMEVDAGPVDGDYATGWPDGSFTAVSVDDTAITVQVGAVALDAPAGVSPDLATLAVQQAVHTADAAVGRPLPVAFERAGTPVARLLGRPVELPAVRNTRVEAPVNLNDPVEGLEVGAALAVRGQVTPVAAEAVSRVSWQLEDASGATQLAGTTAVDAQAWQMTLDVSALPRGRYRIVVWPDHDDPDVSGAVDTRSFVLR
ncbi:hypothetical protein GUY44_24850 [Pimelobacter simplex]|uniref:Uncharacterized protein n=1 Tax=Nocardioides simplex TaxID=2045 RepID=A0A0A1DLA3_NOCSI|nr:hypothetical protein [Pimelobacter simplex]AIY18109.1 hypothetical protein KR76_17455 [Pimelobacter simplex]MCG8153726.1 hypothetical protein [Pimelobacter simplex]GEB15679.1 hypothetical protein NSI01_39940 [Pimelobacter simplex]SFN09193.1 hypothetical protein SAMN05421671_5084 [Pimelobacter simplex]